MSPTDTRTLLLETALNLIWNSNYNSVGVNEICKQAGVTKGSFYHHFESKAELFCEATSHHWDHIRQDLDCILSPINSPLEQLENWMLKNPVKTISQLEDEAATRATLNRKGIAQ